MPRSPDVWPELLDANRRRTQTSGDTPDHRPVAAVLTCSDARVSPARTFDLPAGSLFVVRVAGNIPTPEAIASLTYAVDALGVGTVVVLGHSDCGAVAAALHDGSALDLEPLVAPIRTTIPAECHADACAVAANVHAAVHTISTAAGSLGAAVRAGDVTVHGAVLDLATGAVEPSSPPFPPPSQNHPTRPLPHEVMQ